jgi:hypothetical protein
MQISIDTEKDSQVHIQHVIDLLQKIINASGSSASSSESSAPFADLFGSSSPPAPTSDTSNVITDQQTSNQASSPTEENTADLLASLNAPKEPAKVDVWGNPKKDDDTSFKVEVY